MTLGEEKCKERLPPGSAGADGGCAWPWREPQALLNLANGFCTGRDGLVQAWRALSPEEKLLNFHFTLFKPTVQHRDLEVELMNAVTRLGQSREAATMPIQLAIIR